VGLFAQIPIISAQEILPEESVEQEILPPVIDQLRAVEEAISLGMDAEETSPAGTSSTWAVIRMILVLSLAAIAIYGVVYDIKKTSKPAAANDPFLKILATAHLGSNRYAHIVSVGNKAWLLGSSDGGVNLIGEVDDNDVINAMQLEDSRRTAEAATGRFPDFLSMLRKLGTPMESDAGTGTSGTDNIRQRRERLRGL
jgi:flagellar protein FliO/FliZ